MLFYFRKGFGSNLVKKVRKAGNDLMNKVPRVSLHSGSSGLVACFTWRRSEQNIPSMFLKFVLSSNPFGFLHSRMQLAQ